jgi:hypothetical protein
MKWSMKIRHLRAITPPGYWKTGFSRNPEEATLAAQRLDMLVDLVDSSDGVHRDSQAPASSPAERRHPGRARVRVQSRRRAPPAGDRVGTAALGLVGFVRGWLPSSRRELPASRRTQAAAGAGHRSCRRRLRKDEHDGSACPEVHRALHGRARQSLVTERCRREPRRIRFPPADCGRALRVASCIHRDLPRGRGGALQKRGNDRREARRRGSECRLRDQRFGRPTRGGSGARDLPRGPWPPDPARDASWSRRPSPSSPPQA